MHQDELNEYNLNRDEYMGNLPGKDRGERGDWAGMPRATIKDIFPNLNFVGESP